MGITAKDIKPCYLVNYRCSVHGGIKYKRGKEDVEREGQAETATWETVRYMDDKEEYKAATSIRAKCKREIENLGVPSVLGVILEKERLDDLESLVADWQDQVDTFNAGSQFSNLRFVVVRFEVTGENEVALESMLSDMRDTLDELRSAVESADYKGIREVVQRMKGYVSVLPDNAAASVAKAIEDARVQARQIRRALVKKGEQLEEVQTQVNTYTIDMARFALLDTESPESDDDAGAEDGDDIAAAMAGVRAAAVFMDGDEDADEPKGTEDADEVDADADPFDGLMGSLVPNLYGMMDGDDA